MVKWFRFRVLVLRRITSQSCSYYSGHSVLHDGWQWHRDHHLKSRCECIYSRGMSRLTDHSSHRGPGYWSSALRACACACALHWNVCCHGLWPLMKGIQQNWFVISVCGSEEASQGCQFGSDDKGTMSDISRAVSSDGTCLTQICSFLGGFLFKGPLVDFVSVSEYCNNHRRKKSLSLLPWSTAVVFIHTRSRTTHLQLTQGKTTGLLTISRRQGHIDLELVLSSLTACEFKSLM